MAAAAVELAESYQRKGRAATTLARWLPIAVVLFGGAAAILSVTGGDWLMTMSVALVMLVNIGSLIFNPMARPDNVARSLEQSKRVAPRGPS